MSGRWRNAAGVAIGAGLLVWALHGIEPREIWMHLRAANVWLLALTAILGTLIFPLRVPRWRAILDPVAERLPLGMLWRAIAIGMMGNNVLPARAGELARAYVLSRETERVSFSASFASLAVDRVFDATVVLLLMVVALLDPGFPKTRTIGPYPVGDYIATGTVFALAAIAGLYVLVFFPERVITLYEWFARRLAPRLEARGRDVLRSFASGLSVLRHPGRFAAVFVWTVLHWLVNALAFWVGFRAVGIHAPFSAALLLQGLIAIGVAVPSLPGFFGVFEYVGREGLAIYGVSPSLATSWAISFHVLTFLPITIIGIYYLGTLGLHLRDLGAERRAGSERA